MEIISPRERKTHVEYCLRFKHLDDTNSGYSFPCDEHGLIDIMSLAPDGLDNWKLCNAPENPENVGPAVFEKDEWQYWQDAIGKCECGREVVLYNQFYNSCDCGALYNNFGQRLAPIEQWGEETGESLADMMSSYDPEEIR